LLSLSGFRFFASPSLSRPVFAALLAAIVLALGLWGLGEPSMPPSGVQAAGQEVCVNVSTSAGLLGGGAHKACPVGQATLAEAALNEAVDSEPLQHDRPLMPGRARWTPHFSVANHHFGPLLPGPFRPPAA
jgi:hypothetical protein